MVKQKKKMLELNTSTRTSSTERAQIQSSHLNKPTIVDVLYCAMNSCQLNGIASEPLAAFCFFDDRALLSCFRFRLRMSRIVFACDGECARVRVISSLFFFILRITESVSEPQSRCRFAISLRSRHIEIHTDEQLLSLVRSFVVNCRVDCNNRPMRSHE